MKSVLLIENRIKHCRDRQPLDFPDYLHIELTSRCNLNCIMCNHRELKRPKMDMDFDLFKSIIDQIPQDKVFAIGLYYFGEPLLYPNLVDAIKYVSEKRPEIKTYLRSNGQLLKEKLARELLLSGLYSLQFSIEGGNKRTYEKIMVGGKYETLMRQIEHYLRLKRELNVFQPNAILSLMMDETLDERDEIYSGWNAQMPVVFAKRRERYALLASDKPITVTRHRQPCYDLFYHLTLFSNGSVSFCCRDGDGQISLGNVRDKTIVEIWHGQKAETLRREHISGRLHRECICWNCDWTKIRTDVTPNPYWDARAHDLLSV